MSSPTKPLEPLILRADWSQHRNVLAGIRLAVFVREQGVPEELEWDDADAQALHLLALVDPDATPVGTARLLPTGQIGRMAVLPEWRGRGIGTALLHELLTIAGQGQYPKPFLNAQVSALSFYLQAGFVPTGDIFEEAGIPHRRMELDPELVPGRAATEGVLNRDPGPIALESRAAIRAAGVRMANQARRSLWLLSRNLDPSLYDNQEFIAATRQLAIHGRDFPIRILLWDALPAARNRHRLVPLIHKLTSRIAVRCLSEVDQDRIDAFLLIDETSYIRLPQADIYSATADFHAPREVRCLRTEFQALWDRSEPCRELLRLSL
jgi:predicted GNAT family N-acyltransferase